MVEVARRLVAEQGLADRVEVRWAPLPATAAPPPHLAVVIAGYLHYVVCVINEICAFLNIPCLTIRKVAE